MMKLSDFINKYGDCEVSEEMEKMIQKPKGKWMPGEGELYWFINSSGTTDFTTYSSNSISDVYRINHLRLFESKQEAKRYLEIQKAFKEASFEPDWKNHREFKHIIDCHWDSDNSGYAVISDGTREINLGCPFYFETKEIVEGLIERFGEKDILKYIFGIEEDE